ncbi:MAG TPA: hypothetical protein VHV55_10050 [Pirellulales bacterium]|jgi:hypothetical protein|nr:hypothetical protein [Pirellulales bacterium]
MSTKLVSTLGIAGLWLCTSAAVRAGEPAPGTMHFVQVPGVGGAQEGADINVPLSSRAVADSPVKIMNFSRETMRYQISRTSGKTWTDFYSLPSGKLHQFNADPRSESSIVRTLNGSSTPGYVFIRYPVPGGFESFKLLGNNAYGYVINANGYGEIVEPNLAGQPVPRVARGAQELQLFQLYANHCYFDRQPDQPTPPPGPFMPRQSNLPRSQ